MTQTNFSAIQIDPKTGRMTMSPRVMGFDPDETVKKIIEVKTNLQTRQPQDVIDKVDKKTAALSEFEALVQGYINVLRPLRGVAEGATPSGHLGQLIPQAYSTLNPGSTQTRPEQPLDLIDLYLDNSSNRMSFDIQVNKIAQQDTLKAVTGFNSVSTTLGLTGSLTFNSSTSVTVSVSNEMSLNDIVDAINAQQDETGILASYIAVTPTDNRLYFQAVQTGTPIDITYSASLQALGDQMPPDSSRAISLAGVSDPTSSLGLSGSMYLGATATPVVFTREHSLTNMMNLINAETGTTHINARIIEYNPNDYRLMLTTVDGSPLQLSSDSSLQVSQLPTDTSVRQNLLSTQLVYQGTQVTRTTNEITDLVPNGTLILKKADPDTTVHVTMVSPTQQVNKDIQDWIAHHNKMVDFMKAQTASNLDDGSWLPETHLRDSIALNSVQRFVRNSISSLINGVQPDTAASLADVGIVVDAEGKLSIDQVPDPVTKKPRLETMLENNLQQVQAVLSFNWRTSNAQFGVNGHPVNISDQIAQNGLTLTLSRDDSGRLAASIQVPGTGGFTAAGVVQSSGNYATVRVDPQDPNSMLLNGFQFTYTGLENLTSNGTASTTYTISQGVTDRLMQNFNHVLYPGDFDATHNMMINQGELILERQDLASNKKIAEERIEIVKEKLEHEKQVLVAKFAAMSDAVAKMLNLQRQFSSFVEILESR